MLAHGGNQAKLAPYRHLPEHRQQLQTYKGGDKHTPWEVSEEWMRYLAGQLEGDGSIIMDETQSKTAHQDVNINQQEGPQQEDAADLLSKISSLEIDLEQLRRDCKTGFNEVADEMDAMPTYEDIRPYLSTFDARSVQLEAIAHDEQEVVKRIIKNQNALCGFRHLFSTVQLESLWHQRDRESDSV